MTILLRRRVRVVALLAVAASAVGAGIGYASIPDASGQIHACYHVNGRGEIGGDSTLRVVDPTSGVRAGRACGRDEAALAWAQTGPTGPAGPPGPAGPAGPTNLYSVHTTGDVDTGDTLAPIETLSLPAGSYWFVATVNMGLHITNPFDITETCELDVEAGALSDVVTGFPVVNNQTPGNATIQALDTLPTAGTATLKCMGPSAFVFESRVTALPVTAFTDSTAP